METIVICIVPDEPQSSKIRAIMEKLSSALHSSKALVFPPHITLVGRFKTENYPAFLNAITSLAQKTSPFSLLLPEVGHFTDPPTLFFTVKKTPELQKLHELALELSVDFRTNWKREDLANAAKTPEEKELVDRYGSPFVKQFYHPHLTLAGPDVDTEKFKHIKEQTKEKPITLAVDAITLLRKKDEKWTIDRRIPFGNS